MFNIPAIGYGAVSIMMGIRYKVSHVFMLGTVIENTGKNWNQQLQRPRLWNAYYLILQSFIKGIPILPGFISKWYLSIESIQLGKFLLIFVILLSSLLNAVYYFPIIINGFFGIENLENRVYKSKRAPYEKLAPIIVLITAMLLLGIFSKDVLDLLITGINAL